MQCRHIALLKKSEENLQPYLNEIFDWTQLNKLQLNASKSTATLFTTDSGEINRNLTLKSMNL